MRSKFNFVSVILGCLWLSTLTNCGGHSSSSAGSSPSVSIAQSGSSTSVDAGASAVTLTATVANNASNAGVTWAFSPSTGCGTFSSSGMTATYTPPAEAALNAGCSVSIKATSVAKTSASASLALNINALSLGLPSGEKLAQTVTAGTAGISLSATISHDASGSAAVNWSIAGAIPGLKHKTNVPWSGLKTLERSRVLQAFQRQGKAKLLLSSEDVQSSCGSLSSSSGSSITYTPPATGACTATIEAATSVNPNVTQTFTVTVKAPVANTYTVGGTVSGLNSGASLVLLDNNADALTVSGNGAFTFATALASGTTYTVTVGTEPSGEVCQVTNGGPAAISANVSNVVVACAAASSNGLVAERALAQTGLAIALAENVLISQIEIMEASGEQDAPCTASLDGTVSMQTGSTPTFTLDGDALYPVTLYYGPICAQPYIVAEITGAAQAGTNSGTLTETATYYSPSGAVLGTMALNETVSAQESASQTLTALQANGLGIFTPASGAKTPVQLGLYCTIPTNGGNWPCGGGVAQDFPALKLAIGAVTPLILTPTTDTAGKVISLTFSGSGSVVTGPVGSLTLTNPSSASLAIQGGTAYTTTTANGGAGALALFPPTPTAWNLSDATHDEKFQISVIDDTTRDLSITISQISTGNTLATGSLDQSGTGSITYSDGSTAAITNWTLAD